MTAGRERLAPVRIDPPAVLTQGARVFLNSVRDDNHRLSQELRLGYNGSERRRTMAAEGAMV